MSDLLCNSHWRSILTDGLNARIVVTELPSGTVATAVFRKYGTSVGYVGFPHGLLACNTMNNALMHHLQHLRREGVDVVRANIQGSGVASPIAGGRLDAILVETSIDSLERWSAADVSKRTLASFRKSIRSGVHLRPARSGEGGIVFGFYLEMLRKNRGRLRYSRRYFDRLCRESCETEEIQVALACVDDRPVGFIAVACHEEDAFYIHGGFAAQDSTRRPGYAAMMWAIGRNQELGKKRFHMLASPLSQPSLTEFKESFGGVSVPASHFGAALSLKGRFVLAAVNRAREFSALLRRDGRGASGIELR